MKDMKKTLFHIIAGTTLLLVVSEPIFTQTIRGVVRDGIDGTPLVGANVIMINPSRGTTTGLNGQYEFINIPVGSTPTISTGGLNKTFTIAKGINWMNFWVNPPLRPSDFDGNYYHTVAIGSQTWMVENLLVTHFQNGDTISNVTSNGAWNALTIPGYCWYDNNVSTSKDTYGALYNWYTCNTGHLCPTGWHVPYDAEWKALSDYLGGDNIAGGKLKEVGVAHWTSPNTGATNEYGYTALPGGTRNFDGGFSGIQAVGFWWSATEDGNDPTSALARYLNSNSSNIYNWTGLYGKKDGFSVRCIMNMTPLLTTTSANSVTWNSAQSGGNVTSDGGELITSRGVCWSTLQNPTTVNSHTSDGPGSGTFTSSLTGLSPNTTYYVRAYATNSIGTTYGNEISFITLATLPTLTTSVASDITPVSALSGGTVASDGGAAITERGICWNTAGNPTVDDHKVTASTGGVGSYIVYLTNLNPGTTYYIRAYAINSIGTEYGNQLTFTTQATFDPILFNPGLPYGSVSDNDGNTYRTIQIGNQVWMAENLKTTKYNDGSSIPLITDQAQWAGLSSPGFCWYKNDPTIYKDVFGALYNWQTVSTGNICPTGYHVPTNEEWTALVTYLGGAGVAGGVLKEEGIAHWLNPNTGATNSTGFTAVPAGFRNNYGFFDNIGNIGQWWTSTEENPGYPDMKGMSYNNPYVGSAGLLAVFGISVRCIETSLPQLTTTPVSALSSTSLNSGGNIISDGGAPVSIRGVCWGTSPNPVNIGDNQTYSGSGTGSFKCSVTGLLPNTTYYLRAFATSSAGTAFGNELSFTTPPTVSDSDGNTYNTLAIGSQVWMQENLRTTKYSEGSPITDGTGKGDYHTEPAPKYYFSYGDYEPNVSTWGRYYTWYAATDIRNICPTGWHVPTQTDWLDLSNYLLANGYGIDGHLGKSLASDNYWIVDENPGNVGNNQALNNSTGFFGQPGGNRNYTYPDQASRFYGVGIYGRFQSAIEYDSLNSYMGKLDGNSPDLHIAPDNKKHGSNIRCLQGAPVSTIYLPTLSTTALSKITPSSVTTGGTVVTDGNGIVGERGVCWSLNPQPTTDLPTKIISGNGLGTFSVTIPGLLPGTKYYVRAYAINNAELYSGVSYGNEISFTTSRADAIQDIEGNYYNTVRIGNQLWMQENLKTTKYNNGSDISNVTDNDQWAGLSTAAYSWFNNDETAYKDVYGGLYNWFVVAHGNLCPDGWIVPSLNDWNQLRDFLGGETVAGGKMKESGTLHWQPTNEGTDNSSGFTGLPGGYRTTAGTFGDILVEGMFWTSTDGAPAHAYSKHLRYYDATLFHGWDDYTDGFSVRCMKDPSIVSSTDDSGVGSLRNAIEYSNSSVGIKETITFNIPGTGPFIIQPITPLPAITDPVIIDGYSQRGSAPASATALAKILIEINGTNITIQSNGLNIRSDNCLISGLTINRFGGSGIYINSNFKGNKIAGNYIGTDINGTIAQGNGVSGITLQMESNENIIGGATSSERNVISGNNGAAGIFNHVSSRNHFLGNYIGLDASGKLPLGNKGIGLYIAGGTENIIGSANLNERNVISSNEGDGICFANGAETSVMKGNYIGVDASGQLPLGNLGNGVSVTSVTTNTLIGGVNSGEGNIIAFNSGSGIYIIHNGTINNSIVANSIHSNGGLGIDLDPTGVTLNDAGDADTGPNNLQNFPVLESINYTSSSLTVNGTLNSAASSEYTLQFFANKVPESTGYGEGRTYLGSVTVNTNSLGLASFVQTFQRSSGWGDVITATATDAAGNTSEFSESIGGMSDQIIAPVNWPFHFVVNQEGVPRITNGTDITAVQSSFQTWEGVTSASIDFVDDGTTTQKVARANDHVNLVSFVDNEFPFPPRVLAIAAKTLQINPADNVARIIDADIVVNPVFSDHDVGVGVGNFYDAQSIITHEIGHVMGLLHSGMDGSTMFFMLGYGTKVRSLEQDDKSWVSYKYQGASYNSTFGSISGRILYGEDVSHPPVGGALVMAIRTSVTPSDTIHAYSDSEGNYLVPGLLPGTYNIHIEPLDGNVNGYNLRPGNISTYIYCNTVYTDYPGEYLSIGESDAETADNAVPVTVSAGANTSVADIVTNKDITPPALVQVRPTDSDGNLIKVLSNFIIKFSEPIDESSLTSQTCYLELSTKDGPKQFGGSYYVLPDSLNIIVFNPDSVLRFDKTYALHLTNGIKDLKGNGLTEPAPLSFTTATKDLVPPTIKGTCPVNQAADVVVGSAVNVMFSEAMSSESLTDNFALTWIDEASGITNKVYGSITWNAEKSTLTFTPAQSLTEGTSYTIGVQADASDLSGNKLGTVKNFTFSTVDVAAPEVRYLGPTAGQEGVTIETPVVADFSEPIDPQSVTGSTFSLRLSGSQASIPGDFEFLNYNKRVVFKPYSVLTAGASYSILLTMGIQDVSVTVQHLSPDITSTFSTAPSPAGPSITFLNPTRGKVGSEVTISGNGFSYVLSENLISFNGVTVYPQSATLNTLTVDVPIGTISGPVTVTVQGRTSNSLDFSIIPDYTNDPDYGTSNKSLGSGSSGGSDISGSGEAVFAMVTNPENGTVTRIGLGTSGTTASISTGGLYPVKVDIDCQGKYAYVTNYYSHDVSVIDLTTNPMQVSKIIPVGIGPYGVAVTSDGRRVYVSNYESGNLSMIDVDPTSGGFDHVTANVSTGSGSGNIAVTGDAGMVLVTGPFGLKIVDSNPNSDKFNSVTGTVSSGTKTTDVTVTADAGFAIVATEEGSLLIVNLHPENDDYSGAVVASVPTGTNVSDVKASGDAVYVYATDTGNDQILVYKFSMGGTSSSGGSSAQGITLIPLDPIPVPDSPSGLSISPGGDKIYTVTSSGSAARQVTTISLTGLVISPRSTVEGMISAIQTMMSNGSITKLRGAALIVTLNSALRNIDAGRNKLAIIDLEAFIVMVKTYLKNKQIPVSQGNALVASATVVIKQLKGIKGEYDADIINSTDDQFEYDPVTSTGIGAIYPNPSRDAVTIEYKIAEGDMNSGKIMIKVYDIIGRVVANLVSSPIESGRYSVTWNGSSDDGSSVPRGYYFVRLTAGKTLQVKQIMLIR